MAALRQLLTLAHLQELDLTPASDSATVREEEPPCDRMKGRASEHQKLWIAIQRKPTGNHPAREPEHWIKPRGLVMDFQEHAHQHHHMREALVAALHERQPADLATLRSDRHCTTGCWIHGEGARRWAGNHAFLGLLESHRDFHQQAGLVADQINRGQWTEAQRSLRQGSPFAQALADLSAALRRMRATAESLAA